MSTFLKAKEYQLMKQGNAMKENLKEQKAKQPQWYRLGLVNTQSKKLLIVLISKNTLKKTHVLFNYSTPWITTNM